MDITTAKARLDNCKTRLLLYYEAEKAILTGAQTYWIGTRRLERADLAEIRKMIEKLEAEVDELTSKIAGSGRRKSIRIIPRDL